MRVHLTLSGGRIRHWMCCWKVILTIIGTLKVVWICRSRGPVSRCSLCWRKKPPDGCSVVRVVADKNSSNIKIRSFLTRDLARNVESSSTKRHAALGFWRKSEVDDARKMRGIHFIDLDDLAFQETMRNVRKNAESLMESAMLGKVQKASARRSLWRKNQTLKDQNMHASSKHTNPRQSAWRKLSQRSWGSHCWEWDSIHSVITFCAQVDSSDPSNENAVRESRCGQRMGEGRKIASMANDQSQGQKRRSSKRHRKCYADGRTPLQELGVGTQIPKVQRTFCTPAWHCERRFWLLRSIYGARFVSITNDGRKSYGCFCKPHEDHVAGDNSLQHYNWYTNLFLCLIQWRYPQQKQQWKKNGEKLEKIPAWDLTKVRSKSEVIDEARTKGAKVHFASLMDICHLKNAELETKHQKYKGRVVLRGDIVKDDSGSYAVFTEQGIISITNDGRKSYGCFCKPTRMRRTSIWCSFRWYPSLNGGRSSVPETPQVPVSRQLDASTTTQVAKSTVQHWRTGCSSGAKPIWAPTRRPIVGKTIRKNILWKMDGSK